MSEIDRQAETKSDRVRGREKITEEHECLVLDLKILSSLEDSKGLKKRVPGFCPVTDRRAICFLFDFLPESQRQFALQLLFR